jgi:hypothetical protein
MGPWKIESHSAEECDRLRDFQHCGTKNHLPGDGDRLAQQNRSLRDFPPPHAKKQALH